MELHEIEMEFMKKRKIYITENVEQKQTEKNLLIVYVINYVFWSYIQN